MTWRVIPFIGGPDHIGGRDFWADTDQTFIKVQHGTEFERTDTHDRNFVYHISEKNGQTLAVCGKQCTCPDCRAKDM